NCTNNIDKGNYLRSQIKLILCLCIQGVQVHTPRYICEERRSSFPVYLAIFVCRPTRKTFKEEETEKHLKRTDTYSLMAKIGNPSSIIQSKAGLTSHGRVVDNLSGLDGSPLVSLDPHADGEQTGRKSESLHTHLLTLVHLGLGGPVQEFDNVLGHLGGGGGGAIERRARVLSTGGCGRGTLHQSLVNHPKSP
ncbi:hypothetical protein TMatcc_008029, partial [Talaromyces marneffei ATCC 18224]